MAGRIAEPEEASQMYLLISNDDDWLCGAVMSLLKEKGLGVRVIGNPALSSHSFAWRFNTDCSTSRLVLQDGASMTDREVEGVLVRTPALVLPQGWEKPDLHYLENEIDGALLGWLWSLNCQVINRYPASLWYRQRGNASPLFWLSLLEHSGLYGLPSLISNVQESMAAFALAADEGIAYAPVTAATRYPLVTNDIQNGVAAMRRLGPVHLTRLCAVTQSACIIGSHVVWSGNVPENADVLESALIKLSNAAGLTFMEVTIGRAENGIAVTAVNPYPSLLQFDKISLLQIVSYLVGLLTEEACKGNTGDSQVIPLPESRL
jgi:hypothetical protein